MSALAKRTYAEQTGQNSPDLRVQVEGHANLDPILRDESTVLRPEALRNAFGTPGSSIEVEIRYDERQLRVRVGNDGRGM